MYDPQTDDEYVDSFAETKRKGVTYTNDPTKADAPVAGFLSFLQAHIELLAGVGSFFALILAFGMAALDVITGQHFSSTIASFSPIQGIAFVVGIDVIMVSTLAAAAWAGRKRKFGQMALWYLASVPSAIMSYIQMRVFTLKQVSHLNEQQAFQQIGISPQQYADWRMYAALFLMAVAPWIAKEVWFKMKQLPVVKINQSSHYRPRNRAKVKRTRNGYGEVAPVSTPFTGAAR